MLVRGGGPLRILFSEFGEFFHHDGCLDEFDVFERGVPDNMGVYDDEAGSGLAVFEEDYRGDVVALPDAVEHVGGGFGAGSFNGFATQNEVLGIQLHVFLVAPEGAAAVYVFGILTESLCSAFLCEVASIAAFRELTSEEVIVASFVDFL